MPVGAPGRSRPTPGANIGKQGDRLGLSGLAPERSSEAIAGRKRFERGETGEAGDGNAQLLRLLEAAGDVPCVVVFLLIGEDKEQTNRAGAEELGISRAQDKLGVAGQLAAQDRHALVSSPF